MNSLKMTESLHLKGAKYHLDALDKYDGLSHDAESNVAVSFLERRAESHRKLYERHAMAAARLRNEKGGNNQRAPN